MWTWGRRRNKELKTVLSIEACYALFGFSPGLVQDGFLGVMISCCQQIGLGLEKGVFRGQLGWRRMLAEQRKKSNTTKSTTSCLKVSGKIFLRKLGPVKLFHLKLKLKLIIVLLFVFIKCKVCNTVVLLLFWVCQDFLPITVQIRAWSLQAVDKLTTQVLLTNIARLLFTWAHVSLLHTGTLISTCTHILRHQKHTASFF